jgi:hypothetical protein
MTRALCLIMFVTILSALTGCAGTGGGLGSISKTNQLSPGMKPDQVKAVLGDPSQTRFIADKWVWKYSLHQYMKGFIPYYLVFGNDAKTLQSWYADEDEYQRQQLLWLQSMPPTSTVNVNVKTQP